MAQPIVVKFPAFFPPPIGFRDDHYYGLRSGTDATAYWVDSRIGNDSYPGVDPEYPKKTIQAMVTALRATADIGAQIYCAGEFEESVIVTAAAPTYVSLIGHRFAPWASDVAANPCLTLRTEGWTVEGFEFQPPASAAGVEVQDDADTISAYKTVIRNNKFDGLWSGLYGINFTGAPHRVDIVNNWFIEMHQAGNDAYCIFVEETATGPGSPYQGSIVGNRFSDSDNYVGGNAHIVGFNLTLVKDNIFEEGVLIIPAFYLDLRGGSRGYNIVTGNYFGGAYTTGGGYFAHAATPNSCWTGNMTEPTPATVADNGYTIAVPV